MKLTIFGATGGIGSTTLRQALDAGHEVTAFVRDPARLTMRHELLSTVEGELARPADVEKALAGADAVVCALGSRELRATTVRSEGTAAIVEAMRRTGVKRFVVVSAMGVGESWAQLSRINRLIFALFLKAARDDHEAQERIVKSSGLDWTIVRPSALTDEPGTTVYEAAEQAQAKTSKIPRADVAHFILRALADKTFVGRAITVTN